MFCQISRVLNQFDTVDVYANRTRDRSSGCSCDRSRGHSRDRSRDLPNKELGTWYGSIGLVERINIALIINVIKLSGPMLKITLFDMHIV